MSRLMGTPHPEMTPSPPKLGCLSVAVLMTATLFLCSQKTGRVFHRTHPPGGFINHYSTL